MFPNSIYISYSWKEEDKNSTVEKMLNVFSKHGIEVKRDTNAISYGASIQEYMDKLASGDAIILVLSEAYFKSPNCMYELSKIYENKKEDFRKQIFPIVLNDTHFHTSLKRLPYIKHWEDEKSKLTKAQDSVDRTHISQCSHDELKQYDEFSRIIDDLQSLIADMNHLTYEEHLRNGFSDLISKIESSGAVKHASKLGALFGVPRLPQNFIPRYEYLNQFRNTLLKGDAQAIAITGIAHYVGLQGMGGIGKSILAAALANDEKVQAAFPDGIFWLQFRQDMDDDYVIELQSKILQLSRIEQMPETISEGENLLSLALQNKHCLFIIDDIWDNDYIQYFHVGSTNSRFLITTRNSLLLTQLGASECSVDLLSPIEAQVLLAKYSSSTVDALPDEAELIVKECGYLPLAIAAIGSMVKKKPVNRWKSALTKLQNAQLNKISATYGYQHKNLFKAFQVSVEALPPDVLEYYKTLVIFPEDMQIPESVLEIFWKHYDFGEHDPLDHIDYLVDAALLSRNDDDFLSLHDLLRDYLSSQVGDTSKFHGDLIDAYEAAYPEGWHTVPVEKPYYFQNNWIFHLKASSDCTRAIEIADKLIKCQPALDLVQLRSALEFVDYQFSDITPHLLKESQNSAVLMACLQMLGNEAKEDARRLLKESQDSFVLVACLKMLGNEAKEDARRLLKESQKSDVLVACLKMLGNEAKEDARRLLKESQDSNVLVACLKMLGNEAKEDARRLLKESQDSFVLVACLKMLGNGAKEDTRRLLKESQNSAVLMACLQMLGNEAKEDTHHLLRCSKDKSIRVACYNLIYNDRSTLGNLFPELANLKRSNFD